MTERETRNSPAASKATEEGFVSSSSNLIILLVELEAEVDCSVGSSHLRFFIVDSVFDISVVCFVRCGSCSRDWKFSRLEVKGDLNESMSQIFESGFAVDCMD